MNDAQFLLVKQSTFLLKIKREVETIVPISLKIIE